jgi:predicted RNA binding protein YcfA (HicA-like mRNA interferase family)
MTMKVKRMMDIVEADGWVMVSQRGSHRQYRHATKLGRVTIPGKPGDDLHPKTARSILHQAGLR